MIRFYFLFLLFFYNEAIASVTGKTLICDDNSRGYHFITDKKVNVLNLNLNDFKINTIQHFYELTENVIFIKQPFDLIEKEDNLRTRPLGWIFRRNLDYVLTAPKDIFPEQSLANAVARKKAKRLLLRQEEYFLPDDFDEPLEEEENPE